MLELIRRAPAWRLHTKLYSFDPNLGEGLCVFPSFPFPDSGLNLSNCFDFYFDLLWKKKLKTSNSIPWCTSFHVILSLRTWHIMITTLQHARNEHRSARCFQTCFGSAASAFENIELADIHCALKKNFSVTLKGYICLTDLSRTTCALGRNYKHKVWDSATERFTRRTETMTDLKSDSTKTAATLWR